MNDLNKLLVDARTLVIFKSLHQQPVFRKFLEAVQACLGDDTDKSIEKYCDFVCELYAYSDDLTSYILKLVLENENLFMLRRGEGKHTGRLLEECLANELEIIQELSEIPSAEITSKINYDGFLPAYKIQKLDFSQIYADRIHQISKFGYGIYSQFHVFVIEDSKIVPVEFPDPIRLEQLCNYELEREQVIKNTLALINGKPANNVLLYGDCGTGKSSTVKAIANEYAPQGLRLIELKKKQLHELPTIVETVSRNPLKFIIFVDDLSFQKDDDNFATLKAILEGSASVKAPNTVIYATSNRRHLIRESFADREGDDIHRNDTIQETMSLSSRFGLTILFNKPAKPQFLEIVRSLAEAKGIDMDPEELEKQASAFAIRKGGATPRAAEQFTNSLLAK